jgi:hypothetical protein
MSIEYDIYLGNHRDSVRKGAEWLRSNLPDVLNGYESFYDEICWGHDESKDTQAEYDAYDRYFYGSNRTKSVKEDFNYAWLHHIHNNPHHWQYWVLTNDDPKEGTVALRMPYRYVVEMICDWWAFSWAKDNLYEVFDWYDKHKATMKLHDDTRDTVESILNDIKTKLDTSMVGDGE